MYLNTLANLTLSGNNGSLSNKGFREKKDMDKDGKQQGYRYSRLWLNQYLNEIDHWNIDLPKVRSQLLLDRFLNIWVHPEVDIDEEMETDENFTIYEMPTLQASRPQHWFDIALGKTHIFMSVTCNTGENTFSVRVYVGHRIAMEMLPFLENRKDEIEPDRISCCGTRTMPHIMNISMRKGCVFVDEF